MTVRGTSLEPGLAIVNHRIEARVPGVGRIRCSQCSSDALRPRKPGCPQRAVSLPLRRVGSRGAVPRGTTCHQQKNHSAPEQAHQHGKLRGIGCLNLSLGLPAPASLGEQSYSGISPCQSNFLGYRAKPEWIFNSLLLRVVKHRQHPSRARAGPGGPRELPRALLTRAILGMHSKSLAWRLLQIRDFYFFVSGLPSCQWPFPR